MQAKPHEANPRLQRALRWSVAAAGMLAIVGSGGGSICIPFDAPCPGDASPLPPPTPTAQMLRSVLTTTVGGSVTFEVRTTYIAQPSYSWCRIPRGGGNCETIAGATGPSYTASGVNLGDDDAQYKVTVLGGWLPAQAIGRLAVSSMPGVVHQDGNFVGADWDLSVTVDPPVNGPTFEVRRETAGGNPGAYRSVVYLLNAVPSTVQVFHLARAALYDPSLQGAIYTIDFSEDCLRLSVDREPYTTPLLQQGPRRFVGNSLHRRSCVPNQWDATAIRRSMNEADFVQVDGPPCPGGQTCPDFSAGGQPIALGLMSAARLTSSSSLAPGAVATFAHGFDNWKVTVWRR